MSLGERKAGSCPTCGRNAVLTKEHVFPRWLLTATEAAGEYEAAILHICSPCNASLGRVFEDKASQLVKLMLRGESVALTVRSQKLLAGWFCKTVILRVLLEYQEPTLTDSTRLDQYADAVRLMRSLMDTKRPPSGAYVRISQYDRSATPDRTSFRPFDPPPATYFYSTGLLSSIRSEVLVTKTGAAEVMGAYETARTGAGADSWSIRLWPQPEPTSWPPAHILGPREFAEAEYFPLLALRAARGDSRLPPPLQERVLQLRQRQQGAAGSASPPAAGPST